MSDKNDNALAKAGNAARDAETAELAAAGAKSFTDALLARKQVLLEALQRGDMGAVADHIHQINHARDETLYFEVGRLTRALHNALRDFHLEIGLHSNAEVKHELSEMADARSRLSYVIAMTEDAANQTMDRVDEAAPMLQKLVDESEAIRKDWQVFQAQSSDSGAQSKALMERVQQFLQRISSDGQGIHSRLTDILMAQGYQDLSGQVIKRVIELVSDVEQSLVRLVKLASNVEEVAGIKRPANDTRAERDEKQRIQAEGPQINQQKNQDVMSGQDDVDDLLSSLGF
ncbi:MAG: protein phosphatase [Gammaproteobacteria bacterium]|nr:protein phosphatase [Gammaproteobacteria bacterium]|tara:strand:+ start:3392 stop:4255 length:864 start_codon:yes stop_codon:yes gene_type:complete